MTFSSSGKRVTGRRKPKPEKPRPVVMPSSVRREKPIPDDQWRALAARNPMRVTYPSWRPKSHWDAKDKADPWVLMNGTRDWRKADPRKATFLSVVVGWMHKPVKVGEGSGFIIEPPPKPERRRNW